jgi:metallophosphoesterase (TIGR00282 family)
VDVITLGNHAYRQREVYPYLDSEQRIIRPANLAAAGPGRGETVQTARNGTTVAVINLLGQLFLDPASSPFEMAPRMVAGLRERADVVLIDFHAEATSEKVALGRLLDGTVTAVIGTHTHIQTNDAAVLPGGTAYLTDAGMTGPHDSVIGVRSELVLRRFVTQLPVRFEPAEGDVRIEGALLECDSSGRASAITPFRLRESE